VATMGVTSPIDDLAIVVLGRIGLAVLFVFSFRVTPPGNRFVGHRSIKKSAQSGIEGVIRLLYVDRWKRIRS